MKLRRQKRPKQDPLFRDYKTGGFRDGIVVAVVVVVAVALIWLAYGWALNQPGVPSP
jgi:hypothetical protein